VQRITNLGFDEMASTTIVQMYKGLPETKFEAFKTMIMNQADVPADKRDSFNDWWELAEFTDAQQWQYQNTAYRKDNNGDAKTLTMMFNKDEATNKYTFLVADIKATFHVADDIYIWQKSKSTGVLFEKQT
jgi:hypothetical protein